MQLELMLLAGALTSAPAVEPPPPMAAPGEPAPPEAVDAPAPDRDREPDAGAQHEPTADAVDDDAPATAGPTAAAASAPVDPPPEPAVAAPAPSPPTSPTPDDDALGRLSLTAFVDVAYIVNSNLPNNHVYRGAYTTPRTNEAALNLAGLWLTHEPDERRPFWLQVGFHAGASADANYAAEPTPGGDSSQFAGVEAFKHVSLANAGVKLRSGTDLGGGVFASPVGIGSLFAKDNWLYTNAWESNWVPYYLMGARIGQELPAGFRVEGWVVNGFQMIGDLNPVPSYMVSAYWSGGDVGVAQHLFFGPEQQAIAARGWLVHSDTQVVWDTERVGVGALFDAGRERSLDPTAPGVAVWTGAQASVRAAVLRRKPLRLDVVARPELWWDSRGRTFGNDGYLVSATGGLAAFGFGRSIAVRLEYRYDWSSDPRGYFYRGGATTPQSPGLAADQHNVVLALVGALDYRLPRMTKR
jgi:hypothetical protein